jgi:beta-lactamase regulating signal transducer with metallopeptidase domain
MNELLISLERASVQGAIALLVVWLGTVTQIVFWFHPLVWLARREERMTREQAADALALAITAAPPADYARALVAASLRRNGRIPTLSVGAVERGSRLRQRLDALTQPGFSRRWAMALTGIAVAFALVAFVPWKAVARQETPQMPPRDTVEAKPLPPQPSQPQTDSILDAMGPVGIR